MIKIRGFGFVHYGITVTVLLSAILGYNLFGGDRNLYLTGDTTHGHHQIELQCTACHVEAFAQEEDMQQACMTCHGDEMEKARDTHPKKKFTDPRNSDLLQNLNATQCVTCHVEHSPEITGEFGVTLPEDFCFYCHQEIGEERPSHADFAYTTCSDAGCHNYHDNRALYEKFLAKHIDEPNVLDKRKLRIPNSVALWLKKNKDKQALALEQNDGKQIENATPAIIQQWSESAHATAQVNCSACHDDKSGAEGEEVASNRNEHLAIGACADCHERQHQGFQSGLHGMRTKLGLPPLQVKDAQRAMLPEAGHKTLTCASCHDPHKPDMVSAATDACLGCHNDQHSQNYLRSSHAALWQAEVDGQAESGTGVSCATCHMPRIKKGKLVYVEHNQNLSLEPNSKMLRPVCMKCHGLEFSIAALSDKNLINSNFARAFHEQHTSFDLVRLRLEERKARKRARAKK